MFRVYLSGGMRSGWQDQVKEAFPVGYEWFDPRESQASEPPDFTAWDMKHIEKANVVFAFFEVDNPSGLGLAFEVGYAVGLGKPVVLAMPPGHQFERYQQILKHASTVCEETLEDAIVSLSHVTTYGLVASGLCEASREA